MPTTNPATGNLPADLQKVLADLDAADREARRLVAGLSEAQLNWQPGGGTAWSVGQCLDHLAQGNALYAAALEDAVRRTQPGSAPRKGPISPGWFGRWFIREMEPPPRRKMGAPKKAIPSARLSGAEVLKAFVAAHDRVRFLMAECRELDLNRIRFKNPYIGVIRFTIGTGLLVIGAHDRRHLLQAGKVLEAMQREPQAR
jgi:DinB family protein